MTDTDMPSADLKLAIGCEHKKIEWWEWDLSNMIFGGISTEAKDESRPSKLAPRYEARTPDLPTDIQTSLNLSVHCELHPDLIQPH